MPGSLTSTAHFKEPSTFAGMSSRFGDWPVYLSFGTVFVLARPVTELTLVPFSVTLNFFPPISSP